MCEPVGFVEEQGRVALSYMVSQHMKNMLRRHVIMVKMFITRRG